MKDEMKTLKRVAGAFLTFIGKDYINYLEGSITRYAYIDEDDFSDDEWRDLCIILSDSLKLNRPVNLVIEVRQKGKKFDYLIKAETI